MAATAGAALFSATLVTGAAAATESGTAAALPSCTSNYMYLPSTASGSWECVLGVGNAGLAVEVLQRSLNQCNGQNIVRDGIYGSATRSAVVNVQRKAGIADDGVYGPDTRRNMLWLTATGCNPRR
ncbi:peptidoglycan-binding domain-containing protein [Saccharopolyspora sp. CA-218241]|uniref:peptidoglycan-binding domain-containing protein n=1 Tax=Saccharopolyspora sp. CA-218241 TaxID=3240027 RepID=UPI003D995A45